MNNWVLPQAGSVDLKKTNRIHVASGVVVRNGMVLLTLRGPARGFGLFWETPGVKVEPGETDHAAVGRVFGRRLGCSAIARQCLGVFDFDPPICDQPVHVAMYQAELSPGGALYSREVLAFGWFTIDGVLSQTLIPSTSALFHSPIGRKLLN